jgi:ABC-type proline/glycine betaine transport system ATPase subunit
MHFCFHSWNGDKFNLDQVTVNLTGNKLVMIVGPVGCGKVRRTNLTLVNTLTPYLAGLLTILMMKPCFTC